MSLAGSSRAARLAHLFGCAAFVGLSCASAAAMAQAAPGEGQTLSEIVVTAQKREQSLQDVPIAITALGHEALQTNRVTNVQDLNNLAPNLTVRTSAGGIGIPSFSMRGITSYGVVPGSEKEISIYVDGVYIGSTRGSVFDFPDIERIEVLRGPQGTLFGRNATAGAISVTTRNPSGQWRLRQEVSGGNYGQFRNRTLIDFPQWGPFSASVGYLHDQREGDIKNLGAGTTWTYPGLSHGEPEVQTSPKRLGDKNLNAVLASVRFEPNDRFNILYKFDWSMNKGTPEGVAAIGVDPSLAGIIGLSSVKPPLDPSGKRPKYVNNAFDTLNRARNWGQNVTATLQATDNVTIKNILAYRYSYAYGNYEYTGLGGLNLGGNPIEIFSLSNLAINKQWSDELQVTYQSKFLTLTTGAMYFNLSSYAGGPFAGPGATFANNVQGLIPGGVLPTFNPQIGAAFNWSTSKAVYAQGEFHVTSQLDLIAGYRLTADDKRGEFYNPELLSFTYSNTRPSYTAGVNYKPVSDILLYAKYSTGFVSGGQVADVSFLPETVESWELGLKGDYLEHRLRTNVALFNAKYKDIQSPQAGVNVDRPDLSTVIVDLGDERARGFEAEITALPIRGLTLTGSVGYTDVKYTRFTDAAREAFGDAVIDDFPVTNLPRWTGLLGASYESEPVYKDALVRLSVDASYHSRENLNVNQAITPAFFAPLTDVKASWNVNGRLALANIKGYGGEFEVALWARNLTNNKEPLFGNGLSTLAASASFVPARTFGVDVGYAY
jgi:iron complex outermembrane receptor protein